MYMRDRKNFLTFIGIFALLFFLGQLLFVPKTYLSSRLGQAIQAPKIFFLSFFQRAKILRQYQALSLENQSLRAQILSLNNDPSRIEINNTPLIIAQIFSQYPFSAFNEILINAGSRHGVKAGQAVLAAPDIFLGVIEKVNEKTSVVKTIFSPGWELPTRIGANRISALLIGGHEPRLSLISKNKAVSGGESVLLSSQDFPFGLTIATIDHLEPSSDTLFLEAGLTVPYNLNELNEVFIMP